MVGYRHGLFAKTINYHKYVIVAGFVFWHRLKVYSNVLPRVFRD